MSGMFDYFNRFWTENAKEAFTLSEHALFHLLLREANRQRWKMPIALPTSTITAMLKTTRQNVVKARAGLRNRGIISFRDGTNRFASSEYSLTAPDSHALSQQLSQQLSQELSQELSLHNKKNNKKKDIIPIQRTQETSLDELKEKLSKDSGWLQNIAYTLSSARIKSQSDVADRLNVFFDEQSAQGIKAREESDCRRHFFFWLKKNTNKTFTNAIKNNLPPQRRGSGVSAGTAADFEQPFFSSFN